MPISPFIAFAHKYFRLTENIFGEMSESGNPHMIFTDYDSSLTDEESFEIYDQKTKWSDFKIIEPTLFVFYHGIELLLKGIIQLANADFKQDHNIQLLFDQVENILPEDSQMLNVLKRYCIKIPENGGILQSFFNKNDLSPSKYYVILKYPMNKDKLFYYYKEIHYLEKKGNELAQEIINDITMIKKDMPNLLNYLQHCI